MIKLPKTNRNKKSKEEIRCFVEMKCMICMAFPSVWVWEINFPKWEQCGNSVPSNRVCFHIKHQLDCPYCVFDTMSEDEIRENHTDAKFRKLILQRDDYTCQACGYKQTEKPVGLGKGEKGKDEAKHLYKLYLLSLERSDKPKSLHVAHFHKRYGEESYERRHTIENARTLCVDCHNMETAKHQMDDWLKRMKECPRLKTLE